MKKILSPLIVEYYEEYKVTTSVASAMSALAEETVTFSYGIEYGMGDDAKGLSVQEVQDFLNFTVDGFILISFE